MITPLDIERKEFKKTAYGYSIKEVNEFMQQLLKDYETIYRQNIDLKDKISVLNDGIKYYKTIEDTLQNTLITAEKTAEEKKMNALKQADLIEQEAQNKAKEILNESKRSVFDITQKIDLLYKQHEAAKSQLKHFYQSQLELIDNNNLGLISERTKSEVAITNNNGEK